MEREAKIHALLCIYNDAPTLPLALSSLKGNVDFIKIADGAYQKYYETYKLYKPDAQPWSTDGSLEMLKIIPDLPPMEILNPPNGKPWVNQCEKRTAMLNMVPDGDWFIIIDSDEMLFGDVEEGVKEILSSGCIAGKVPFYNIGLDMSGLVVFWHPRVFMKLPDMHYTRKHWHLADFAHRIIENTYPIAFSDAFVMGHLKVLREHDRLKPHMSYMRKMDADSWLEPNYKELQ